ncbi:hypothetical protein LWI28_026130 [Acer negundo]|uniref:Uncharacterized protein n=1 Tax=Acer negundo TaxID=4023 RepID=A0AAD5NYH4_ACENE|nr:hypothetical protein LWI28_026130 [Acer negundo]
MLTGRVSPVLSGLKMIRSLNVSSNSFSGDLLELGGFPNLIVFNVSNNSFTGMLNSQIWSASNGTEILDLSMNNFAGNLQGLDNCSSTIKELHVDVNSLSGHLPGELPNVLGNLTNLQFFIANSNFFSGPLPLSLALCLKIHVLDLRNNSLTDSIDLNFTGLPSLGMLVLARCYQCKNVTTLILAVNFIGEEIPKNVIGFESLMVLGIGYCGLKGHIPVWLSSCKKLHVLDLSWNHLDGKIPPWIGLMENLFYLD